MIDCPNVEFLPPLQRVEDFSEWQRMMIRRMQISLCIPDCLLRGSPKLLPPPSRGPEHD